MRTRMPTSRKDEFYKQQAFVFENFYVPNRPRRFWVGSRELLFIERVIYSEIQAVYDKVLEKMPEGATILLPAAGANIYLLLMLNLVAKRKFNFILLDNHKKAKIEFYKMLAIFAFDVLHRRDAIKRIAAKKGNPFGPHFNKFLDSVYSYLISPPRIGLRQFFQRTEIGKLRHDAQIKDSELSKHMRKFAKDVLGVGMYVVEDIQKLKLKNILDAVFLYTWMDLFLVLGRADPLRDDLDKIITVYKSIFAPLVRATKKFLIVFESEDSGLRALFKQRSIAAMHELKLKGIELDTSRERIDDVYTNIVVSVIPSLGIKVAGDLWHRTENDRAQFCVYKK